MSFLNVIKYLLKFFYYVIITLHRDILGLITLLNVKMKIRHFDKNNLAVPDVFKNWVDKQPNKECLVFDNQVWTFLDVSIKYLKN